MTMPAWNFEAFLTDDRGVVPDSLRRGHNVLTKVGARALMELVCWEIIKDVETQPLEDDFAWSVKRIRWFEVGAGSWLETPGVRTLRTPLLITGGDYLRLASVAPAYPDPSRPTRSAVRFSTSYTKPELAGDPLISEVGLIVDANDTGGVYSPPLTAMPATTQYPDVAFYKVIDPPLQKLTGVQNLIVRWELRF